MVNLEYKDHAWKLTINGNPVPLDKIIANSLRMDAGDVPVVSILVDKISIEDIIIDEQTEDGVYPVSIPKNSITELKEMSQ